MRKVTGKSKKIKIERQWARTI